MNENIQYNHIAEKEPSVEQTIVTRLIIEKDKEVLARNTSQWKFFDIKGLSIARSELSEGYDFYKLKNLSRTNDLVVVARDAEGIEQELQLPQIMLDRLAEFISKDSVQKFEQNIDCVGFAYLMNGKEITAANFNMNDWSSTLLEDESELKIGDTIFMALSSEPQKTEISHFAVYLGQGLYLSKFGASGNLMVTNIREMNKAFGGDFVFKAELKK